MTTYEIRLLGGFAVLRDGVPVPGSRWGRRHAALLVKRLALAPGRRLHREQVVDALWPDLGLDEAAPRLHKAAHYARRALGADDAVVLRGETVALLPDAEVTVDALAFEVLGRATLERGDPGTLVDALGRYGGELLPEDLYEPFTEDVRDRLRRLHLDLLRRAGRWEEVLAADPADEESHLALMRRYAAEGDRHAALRQYERMDRVLGRELGVQPGPDAQRLRVELLAAEPTPVPAAPTPATDLVGRERETALVRDRIGRAAAGRGQFVFVTGSPGIGKSALLAWARECATTRSFRVCHGTAASVEGAWPYAPVLEALAGLCRRHPTLLDGLDDRYREEIDRALGGGEALWDGESAHQRLFVAVVELVRLAAGASGLLLTLDDLHEADTASLRLLHYLARSTRDERVAILVSARGVGGPPVLAQVRASLVSGDAGTELALRSLGDRDMDRLLAEHAPTLSADARTEVAALAAGVPFAALELAAGAADPATDAGVGAVTAHLDPATTEVLRRVAVVGTGFDTDEFVALAGLADEEAYDHLDRALAARVLEHADHGYRFRHPLVREALLRDLPPHRHRTVHRDAARRLASIGASPARVGHHLAQAGDPAGAVPHLLRAAEASASVGAYQDALGQIDLVREHATGDERSRLLALRADVFLALGDIGAPLAYREAIDGAAPADRPLLRARLARACLHAGDLETAAAVLKDLEPDGGPADADILLAQGNLAFFRGDLDRAWSISLEAKQHVLGGDRSWQALDLVALQGLLAHTRGEWFDTLRIELRRVADRPELASSLFDGYLCPAEYLLYGPMPYAEVIDLARNLRVSARRAGAMRGVAFATALIGEAALLSGDLALAADELTEAIDLHRDTESRAGEAHCMQRLAEVRLAEGDAAEAQRLCERALLPARWSNIALHLLQRIFGTLALSAPDAASARGVVERAEAVLRTEDFCPFCDVMFAVPAAIVCAAAGDVEHARRYLERAERSGSMWDGGAWQAAVLEAQAHVLAAEGEDRSAQELLARAAVAFDDVGQPIDAARCRRGLPARS